MSESTLTRRAAGGGGRGDDIEMTGGDGKGAATAGDEGGGIDAEEEEPAGWFGRFRRRVMGGVDNLSQGVTNYVQEQANRVKTQVCGESRRFALSREERGARREKSCCHIAVRARLRAPRAIIRPSRAPPPLARAWWRARRVIWSETIRDPRSEARRRQPGGGGGGRGGVGAATRTRATPDPRRRPSRDMRRPRARAALLSLPTASP